MHDAICSKFIEGSTHYLGDKQDFNVSSEGRLSGIGRVSNFTNKDNAGQYTKSSIIILGIYIQLFYKYVNRSRIPQFICHCPHLLAIN